MIDEWINEYKTVVGSWLPGELHYTQNFVLQKPHKEYPGNEPRPSQTGQQLPSKIMSKEDTNVCIIQY
jgi:hypothetical protein